jgi:nucleoside 2-deoxyribosyltransferase
MVYGGSVPNPVDDKVMKIYLAGPDVFLPDAVGMGRRKKELCRAYGFEGLFPFDSEVDPNAGAEPIDRLIYRANEAMIREADLGIFNLTPFRGPSADAGTVFELGLMVGLGKRIFGYTNIAEDFLDRCKAHPGRSLRSGGKGLARCQRHDDREVRQRRQLDDRQCVV